MVKIMVCCALATGCDALHGFDLARNHRRECNDKRAPLGSYNI